MNQQMTPTERRKEFSRLQTSARDCIQKYKSGSLTALHNVGDLVAYAEKLEGLNIKRTLKAIFDVCEKCGHTTTEDGCCHCVAQELESVQYDNAQSFYQLFHCGVSSKEEIERHNYKLKDLVCIIIAQRDQLRAQVEELKKDKERLDWLSTDFTSFAFEGAFSGKLYSPAMSNVGSIREAIDLLKGSDEAMSKEKKG